MLPIVEQLDSVAPMEDVKIAAFDVSYRRPAPLNPLQIAPLGVLTASDDGPILSFLLAVESVG